MQRRKWSSKDKLTIVLEGLKGAVPLGELCAKFQISPSQYYKWRDQLLANGPKVFDYGGIEPGWGGIGSGLCATRSSGRIF